MYSMCVCVFFGGCVFVRQNDFTCGEKKRERERESYEYCIVLYALVWFGLVVHFGGVFKFLYLTAT